MNPPRPHDSSSPLPPRFSRHSAVVRPRLGWLDRFIRIAGSVAVDHTHLLPLNTLEAELRQRAKPPAERQCC